MNTDFFSKAVGLQDPLFHKLSDHLSDALIITNKQLLIEHWNKAASQLYGFTTTEVLGKNLLSLLLPDYEDDGFEKILSLVHKTSRWEGQLNFIKKTRERICLDSTFVAAGTDSDGITGLIIINRGTAKSINENEILHSEKKWRSLLNNSKGAFYLLDINYHILLINEQAEKIFRVYTNESTLKTGAYFPDILPETRREPIKEILNRVLLGERIEYEVFYPKENNKGIWLLIGCRPVKNDQGEISQVCITAYDITTLKENEAALIKSEQRWKFALDGAGDGVWEYNFQTKEIYFSPLYKKMLGFTEDEFQDTAYEWHSRVHPLDSYKITDIDTLYEDHSIKNHSIEYRLKSKSGDYVWVLDRGMLLERTADGKPLKLIGTHTNITERKIAEERLVQSEHRFSSFMANTPTLAWIIDEYGVFRYLNAAYKKTFRLEDDTVGKSVYDVFSKEICDEYIKNNWTVFNTNMPIEVIEESRGPDNEKILYHINKFPLESKDGIRLLGGIALDITKRIEMEQRLAADEAQKKKEIIHAIINAQEKERKELAYELHDNVNQILSSSKLMLQVAIEKPELGKEFTNRSMTYLQDAINEIRKISYNLTPGILRDISLEDAVEDVIQNINATEILKINYHKKTGCLKEKLSPEIQLAILRIIQAQLNNILKHANASEANISLFSDEHNLILEITDNGKGFDPVTTKKGLGLNNMFNRVEYYQGSIQLTSSYGKGCTLHIEIPI